MVIGKGEIASLGSIHRNRGIDTQIVCGDVEKDRAMAVSANAEQDKDELCAASGALESKTDLGKSGRFAECHAGICNCPVIAQDLTWKISDRNYSRGMWLPPWA
jgi:hypothetical protein